MPALPVSEVRVGAAISERVREMVRRSRGANEDKNERRNASWSRDIGGRNGLARKSVRASDSGADERTVVNAMRAPVGADGLAHVLLVRLVVALEPADPALSLEDQEVRRDPVEEPAIVADDNDAAGESRIASSRARSVSTSRSFVGSSRSSTFPPDRRSFPRWTRLRSPPERSPTFFCWSAPRKLSEAAYARAFRVRPPIWMLSSPPETSSHTVLFGSSVSRV